MSAVVRFRSFESGGAAAQELQALLRQELQGSTEEQPRAIMLAGGRTPLEVYQRIAAEAPRARGVRLVLSDERHVLATDPQSNYGQILPMGTALGVPEERFAHLRGELPLEEAVADFSRQLVDMAAAGVTFSLGILGIGADGHTASLFTPEQVTIDASGAPPATTAALALPTGTHGGVPRVSLSANAILSFQRLVFFAAGEEKREILTQILNDPGAYPAGMILTAHPAAEIWSDVAPEGATHE